MDNTSTIPATDAGNGSMSVSSSANNPVPTYDYSNGKWGIDNWFRNLFSFGEYNKKRDADYQQWLDNTAMQRRVADLKAAGLNPVLAANGQGASTSASAGVSSSDGSYKANPFTTAFNIIKEFKKMKNDDIKSYAALIKAAK